MSKQGIKKLIFTSLILVAMFGLFKNLFSQGNGEELTRALQSGKALLVDVRTPSEFASGSVPGAINVPLDVLPARLDSLRGHDTIVVFCRSGGRSTQAKAILERAGITGVVNGGPWGNVAEALAALSR